MDDLGGFTPIVWQHPNRPLPFEWTWVGFHDVGSLQRLPSPKTSDSGTPDLHLDEAELHSTACAGRPRFCGIGTQLPYTREEIQVVAHSANGPCKKKV